ncbi:MAG: ABC transporter permease [Acidobacteria bacterium]|nr:MAG: ABC transporter permease [Acidobacteriota bacterium]REK01364.1 MAG: ABC transporter permease [Acidobacteriota bacterium]REK14320.1 MAG: ABC transporter permease [Acidobacteriota bacterium]REK45035.1 MAG: ABC transporter permease [Acidobacteriota bacterium]
MNFTETLKLALSAIWAHKLRSFLTLLGMIIAVAAFMLVVSFLLGFIGYVDEKIAGVGSNAFTIQRFGFDDFKDTDTLAAAQRRNKDLTFEELEFIRERADLIALIGAKARRERVEVKRGGKSLEDIEISGFEPVIEQIDKLDIEEGRFFSDVENENSRRVAYIGKDIANELFPRTSPIGGEIFLRGIPYRVIGVQVAKGTVFGQPQDNFVTIPIKTFETQFGSLVGRRGPYFQALAVSEDKFEDAVEQARTLMRIKRGIPFGEKDNFSIITPDAITGLRDSIFGPIFVAFLIVPSIAMIVGAIVIMNIMLVAVTERTKEIGIRKSLGAKQTDILRQFLIEAATLSAIGGLIGLGIAILLGVLVTMYIIPTSIPWWAAVLAIGISAAVGILAGLYPAWKAARLDPIEALRTE